MYCPPEFLNVYAYQVAHVIKADPYVDPMVFSTKAIVTFIDKLASKVIISFFFEKNMKILWVFIGWTKYLYLGM